MMDFNSWFFMISFFLLIGVTIYKLYRLIMEVTNKEFAGDGLAVSWIYFIVSLFLWLFCLIVVMVDNTILIFSVLQNVANFLLAINVLMLIIAHLVAFKIVGQVNLPTRYKANNRFMRRF